MANSNVHNNNQSNNSSNTVINTGAENSRIKALRDKLNSTGNEGIGNGASSRLGDIHRDRVVDIPIHPTPPIIVVPVAKDRNSHKDVLDTNHDNSVSDQEIMAYELNRRKANGEVLDLSEDEAAQKVLSSVDAIDKDDNGIISAVETLSAILASKAGAMDINDANKDMVLNTNDKFAQIKQALANISTFNSGNGNSALEVLFDLNKAGLSDVADWTKADYLKNNPQIVKFFNTVKAADPNADGVVSDDEVINLHWQYRQNANNAVDQLSYSAINYLTLVKNPNGAKILNALNLVDPNKDGIVGTSEFADIAALVKNPNNGLDAETLTYINKVLLKAGAFPIARQN